MAEVKTNVRLPEELYDAIKRLAEKDLRSINAEIQALLREAIEARGTPSAGPRQEGRNTPAHLKGEQSND